VVAGVNIGVAPEAQVVGVRISPARTTTTPWMTALDAVIQHAWAPDAPPFRTAIINISHGLPPRPGPSNEPSLATVEQKIRDMIGGVDAAGRPDPNGKRFLFVLAALNYYSPTSTLCDANRNVVFFPQTLGSSLDGLVTVGGTTRANDWWSGSCGGSAIDVAAPADDLLLASSSAIDHYLGPAAGRSGTSYAAPYVAGIAARMLELDPELTPAALERLLKASPSRVNDRDLAVPMIAVRSKSRAAAK
jgi:subtilisin family serine protease